MAFIQLSKVTMLRQYSETPRTSDKKAVVCLTLILNVVYCKYRSYILISGQIAVESLVKQRNKSRLPVVAVNYIRPEIYMLQRLQNSL